MLRKAPLASTFTPKALNETPSAATSRSAGHQPQQHRQGRATHVQCHTQTRGPATGAAGHSRAAAAPGMPETGSRLAGRAREPAFRRSQGRLPGEPGSPPPRGAEG